MIPIKNALTGFVHEDKFEGTIAEREFYRVMPLGSSQKLFFDNLQEYAEWRCNTYIRSNPDLSEKEIDQFCLDPFGVPPAPIVTDFLSCYSDKNDDGQPLAQHL